MTELPGHDGPETEVSFAEVANEDPEDSVAREADATDDIVPGGAGEPADPAVLEDNAPPMQPTISSLTGGGPVADGSELAP